MNRFELRIEASYLVKCSPQAAYNWLYEHRATGEEMARRLTEQSGILESLLVNRRDPLIDLGIARFGKSPSAIRAVFGRGDIGIRCAALSNPLAGADWIHGWLDLERLCELLTTGTNAEQEALIKNEFLRDEILEQLLERVELFADIPYSKFRQFLVWLGDNPRMSKPYDERVLDGWAQYKHERIFKLAWELAKTIPTEPVYASVLSSLLSRTKVPVNFENTHSAIERWRIEKPDEIERHPLESSYWLRSRLADALKADDDLLNSDDSALRLSFYRRFDPHGYVEWPKFIEKDGELAFNAMLRNDNLWRCRKLRYWLSELAWVVPDPRSNMDAPNSYRAVEDGYFRKHHPEWFRNEDNDCGDNPDAIDPGIAEWLGEKRRSISRERDEKLGE